MKNNNNKILNYLSGRMTDEESHLFDKELSESKELKAELELVKARLTDLKVAGQVELDERYFANLLPRVFDKLETKKKFWRINRLYYLVPTAAAVIVMFLLLPGSKNTFEIQYGDLTAEVINNISDKDVSEHYLADLDNYPWSAMLSGNEETTLNLPSDLKLDNESISKLVDNSDREEYSSLRSLSDTELENIYNKLAMKNSR
jgi:hypothetical protein